MTLGESSPASLPHPGGDPPVLDGGVVHLGQAVHTPDDLDGRHCGLGMVQQLHSAKDEDRK